MEWIRQRDNLLKIARRTNLSIDWSLYTRAKWKTSNSIKLQNDVSFKKQKIRTKGTPKESRGR